MRARARPTRCDNSPACGRVNDERDLYFVAEREEALSALAGANGGLAGPALALSSGPRLRARSRLSTRREWPLAAVRGSGCNRDDGAVFIHLLRPGLAV